MLKIVGKIAGAALSTVGGTLVLSGSIFDGLGLPGWVITLVGGLLAGGGIGFLAQELSTRFITKKTVEKFFTPAKVRLGQFFRGLGIATTLGMSRWKYTKGLWNVTIEPLFILVIGSLVNIVKYIWDCYQEGLATDNTKKIKK